MRLSSQREQGFTLIELLVTIVIVAILAAMAVPLYTRYVVRAAEADAQSQMGQMAMLLASFKSKNFNYRGFDVSQSSFCGTTGCGAIAGIAANSFTLPLGSATGSNALKYTITLADATTQTSLASIASVSQQWTMLAVPNKVTNTLMTNASYMILSSDGLKCKTTATLTISSANCGIDGKDW